jgi:hypothetical protein
MNRKTLPTLSSLERRRFIKSMGLVLGAAATPALRYALHETLFGTAYADAMNAQQPTFFIEINYRDQVDLGEVFVAPGLATYTNLTRGETGDQCAMFYQQSELFQKANNIYLTPESKILEPHLDTIACIDTCELTQGDIHYHTAANRNRAPDCTKTESPGVTPMFNIEYGRNQPQGCENYYSGMPTPASLHNYLQKQLSPDLKNGVAMKGITRDIHTVYHHGAGLPGAELDRMQTKNNLYAAFPKTSGATPTVLTPAQGEMFDKALKRIDARWYQRRHLEARLAEHSGFIDQTQVALSKASTQDFDLPLTQTEIDYWRTDVPEPDSDTGNVDGQDFHPTSVEFQIWEQYALASKIITSGKARTVALECEFVDIHNKRPRKQMQVHSKQLAIPLARLIDQLKLSGIYDRTLIAIYTLDGSRPPAAGYSGDRGKSTVMLAGGMIRGGYFGDIRIAGSLGDGHEYSYHMPDLTTGVPISNGVTGGDLTQRVPGAVMWKTVAKAMGAPDSVVNQYATVASVSPLPFVLR